MGRYFMPNFGLFILAIVFFMSSTAKALKCSLPDVDEFTCPAPDVLIGGKPDDKCCCFSTRCKKDSNLISKGCAQDQKEAAEVAKHQCKPAGGFDETLTKDIMLCHGDMCNDPKLKCSLPDGSEYQCEKENLSPEVDSDGDACCCFSTLCSKDDPILTTSKGCAKDQDEAAKVATNQCKHANVPFNVPKEDIMLCRGDMCNGWYPWAKVPINKAEEQAKFFGIAQSMLQASSTSAPAGNGQGGVDPAGNGQGGVDPAGNGQGGVDPAGNGQGGVDPAGNGQGGVDPAGNGQGGVDPAGNGQGGVDPAGNGQGGVDPAGNGQGGVDPAGNGQGGVDPAGNGQGGVDPAGNGQGGVDPAGNGQGGVDPAGNGQGGVDPAGNGQGGVDPAGNGQGGVDPAGNGQGGVDPARHEQADPV